MRAFLLLAIGCLGTHSLAQDASSPEPELDEVVVTGEFPGPGMWKVTRAGDAAGHALWIVGEPWPLPRGWKWKSRDIEARVLASQEILWDAGFNVTTDEKVSVFRGLTLLPAVLKARRNPDDARLVDVLPPDVYARWQVQKKRYLGREKRVESWRPLFAADKLRNAALDELDLQPGGLVSPVVGKLAKKHKIKSTVPQLKFTFKRSEIRDRIKEFSRESLADVECLDVMLDFTEALGRRDIEDARARAWAAGDLDALDALPPLPSPSAACLSALMSSQVARDLVPADVREQAAAQWLEAVDAALAANPSTFAVVPFVKLTRAGGYLERLAAKGYAIELPH